MKKILLAMVLLVAAAAEATIVDYYDFRMSIRVPRIYNNSASLGCRRYQTQNLTGVMTVSYDEEGEERPVVGVSCLVNKTHKINGKCITYGCTVDEDRVVTRVNLIGDNRKDVFKTPSVVFYLDAEPDYSVGEDDEDNSLLVTLAGSGSSGKKCGAQVITYLSGRVAGTLGCGCKAYGHVSPTRVAGPCGATERVDDVASVFGNWYARWRGRGRTAD